MNDTCQKRAIVQEGANNRIMREQLLSLIIDYVPAAISILDRELRVLTVSRRFREDYRITDPNVSGKSIFEILPELPQHWTGVFHRCLRGIPKKVERDRLSRRGGNDHWVKWEVVPWYGSGREIGGLLFLSEMITSQVHAEQALMESERLLKTSQSIGKVGSWEFDISTDTLKWSEETFRIFGVDPEQFQANADSFYSLVHPDDRERVEKAYFQSIENEKNSYEVTHRLIRKNDGEIRTVFEKCLHERDTGGNVIRSTGFVQDITEQVHAQTSLEKARHFAENLIETANVIFVQLDMDGNVIRINEAGEQITGYLFSELAGKNWFETIIPKNRYPEVWERFNLISKTEGLPRHFENPILTKSGEERHLVWRNSLLHDNGDVAGTISFGMDVTERVLAEKKNEKQLEEMKRYNQALIDREVKMISLKKEINELLEKMHMPAKYTIPE